MLITLRIKSGPLHQFVDSIASSHEPTMNYEQNIYMLITIQVILHTVVQWPLLGDCLMAQRSLLLITVYVPQQ